MHCQPVGSGQHAFKYLAPYIFRVAISNNRILQLADGHVTFQYKDAASAQLTCSTVTAEEFIRRFLQHVLPDRFIKVRYYGLLSPGNRHLLNRARQLLTSTATPTPPALQPVIKPLPCAPRCPNCARPLILVQTLRPTSRWPP